VSNCGASDVRPCAIARVREMLRARRRIIWRVRVRCWSQWESRPKPSSPRTRLGAKVQRDI
jgi:hypothetical protein